MYPSKYIYLLRGYWISINLIYSNLPFIDRLENWNTFISYSVQNIAEIVSSMYTSVWDIEMLWFANRYLIRRQWSIMSLCMKKNWFIVKLKSHDWRNCDNQKPNCNGKDTVDSIWSELRESKIYCNHEFSSTGWFMTKNHLWFANHMVDANSRFQ